MTRVVAGRWRGRRLRVPRAGTRPTSDRVREAVFARLDHQLGDWAGLAVLDLYAGSGALGIEALSRGAARATFVEADRHTAGVIRGNVAAVGAQEAATVLVGRVERLGPPPDGRSFDVVLADPPYELDPATLATVLSGVAARGWIATGAEMVVETARRSAGPPWPSEFERQAERDYGDTRVWYGRAQPADEHEEARHGHGGVSGLVRPRDERSP